MVETNYQKVIKDIGGVIEHVPVVAGKRILPTSATVTIKTSDDQDLPTPVTAASATIANDGKLTYTITAANADLQKNNYEAKFSFVFGGTTYIRNVIYDSVLAINYLQIDKRTVQLELPQLLNADLGDYNWSDMIVHCFREHLERDARNRGRRLHLLSRPADYRPALMYKILETVCNNQIEEVDDKWMQFRDRYSAMYKKELEQGIFAYDADDDDMMDDDESFVSSSNTRLRR